MTKMRIRQAVFPVAGMGTRLLPQTKIIPKEMLSIVDKPIIQYAVEEALEAGIEKFIFVTSKGKNAIEDHFDEHPELETLLEKRSKHKELEILQSFKFKPGQVIVVRQPFPMGLGHAVWCARHVIDDPYFAVLLPDDVIMGSPSCLHQMTQAFQKKEGSYAALMEVPNAIINRYGAVLPISQEGKKVRIQDIVEKPSSEQAPSNMAVIGRYILPKNIFNILEKTPSGAGGEIQLTDALKTSIAHTPFWGYLFEGQRFDCGTRLGLIEANIAYALTNKELKDDLLLLLKEYSK